jgi:hypothetical protein
LEDRLALPQHGQPNLKPLDHEMVWASERWYSMARKKGQACVPEALPRARHTQERQAMLAVSTDPNAAESDSQRSNKRRCRND